jgi:hypothetical protein
MDMSSFPWSLEPVIRHRGTGRDEDGKLVAATSDVTLMAIGVAPGFYPAPQSEKRVAAQREGEDIGAVVYFDSGTDLNDSTDELTVRGTRYRITVNDWQTADGRGGLAVVCVQGKG